MPTARDDDVELVADFVRRLRRVALHPLALDERGGDGIAPMPGAYLRRLLRVEGTLEVRPDRSATMRSPLPDEVLFESLATRVRTFTLKSDRLHWPKVLDALDRLTGLGDNRLRLSSEHLRQVWTHATERNTTQERAYVAGYRVGPDGEDGEGHYTDIDLAYAWLYQDVAHGDAVATGYFDVKERFRAAVGVFSHIAVLAIETLHYLNHLVQEGLLDLPVGTFSDPVVVTDREYVRQVYIFDTEVGADLSVLDADMPEHLRPALEVAKKMMANSKSPPTDS
ncbi:MAG: hypothetical protein WBW75_10895 [Mycobacterium sp.]|uniref:hypothetical protein n=1 Tax=Mycobacterium sp. TaxID=1785 RepID=UPI003C3BCC13